MEPKGLGKHVFAIIEYGLDKDASNLQKAQAVEKLEYVRSSYYQMESTIQMLYRVILDRRIE